jgi:ribosomal protein S18 acetylase RimI-like enzyme
MNIRPAEPADIPALARIQVRARKRDYETGLIGPAVLDEYRCAEEWRNALNDPDCRILVFSMGNSVLGMAAYGPPRARTPSDVDSELWALYVDPDRWRAGIGRALWVVAANGMTEGGAKSAGAWVLLDNIRARFFYEAVGFTLVPGALRETNQSGGEIREIFYRFELVTAHAAAY